MELVELHVVSPQLTKTKQMLEWLYMCGIVENQQDAS